MRMLPTLINYKVIRHTLTYWKIILIMIISIYIYHTLILIHQWRLMICITIDNGSNNTVENSCYSAHQAVSRLAKHHIDMVSCVHSICQTRAGVSSDIKKYFECVTITNSKFLIEYWYMNDDKEHIEKLGNNMTWTIGFLPP